MEILIENATKKFILRKGEDTFLAKIKNSFNKVKTEYEIRALENINLKIEKGEIVGLIGKNGSGKSTLLKTIAGIYSLDAGKIETKTEPTYISGFGNGLSQKLTMKENIFLLGALAGLSQSNIKKIFKQIVEFSGLENYVDAYPYQFSSGMITRLSFSIGIFCLERKNPEIILLDEVIGGGGDLEFQEKSMEKMEQLIKNGATVIFASHSLSQIKNYCAKTIWMDEGKIKQFGETKGVLEDYENNFKR